MGLFSKLFGGAGSDKADRMRQHAIDAFNSIQTPALKDLQIQLDKYVAAGRLTPEQAEAELLNSTAFEDIVTDPALEGAQKEALVALQEIGTQGGLTAIDKARMADITAEQTATARGRNEAIMRSARERGMGTSDLTLVNQMINEQAAADRASRRGTDVAAQAEARALQALMQGGQLAGQIRGQDYGEQANLAQSRDALDKFNTQTLNQTNLYNVDAMNKAQAANLANEQAIANANVGTTNEQRRYNAEQHQRMFENEMRKAEGVAGTYNQWAGDATAAKRSEQAADAALLGGAISAGATALGGAFAGPAGAAGAGAATSGGGGFNPAVMSTNPNYKWDPNTGYNFSEGGQVPGKAPMPGNHPANDTVPAKLSPGEVVVPRTAMSDEEEFEAFMAKFHPANQRKRMMEGQ